ncbi:class I SAM-dependent methyltransferase [Rhodohalobacter sulfatireducens]|uniref:Methyltransferase domain-containing protein n=1 Tax=Rhodohalobacter sulfatireducens TaxID=2911366 RepID=A0ABS9K8U0_9BACT|nr:methyltransferase domain-containing protein [Rhodohalobacter sulfatireducens]MCG2587261.1 methyltransferase domain-containing protein [Rhodohalobacter sulfatireducens]MDR9366791.1 methyltransferase domain-containing protein [Balneolaceae bacterium]MDR9408381.1 methyltransferase domain-containing protein [Balneolaceae bacterium]
MRNNYVTLPGKWKHSFLTILTMLLVASCSTAQQNSADIEWLIESLQITEGSVIADIGAGDGDQSIELAQYVGSEGHIYSTEIGEESLQNLRRSIEGSELSNVTVLEGHPQRTNLPEACCDGIFLRRVYHHIGDPPSFNASLLESLKPGGRLAIIDFRPRGEEAEPGERAEGDEHGVTPETVIEEITSVGFELIDSQDESGRFYYIMFSKPE